MSSRKQAAAVDYLRREADLAAQAVERAQEKLTKFQQHVAECEVQLENAVLRAQADHAAAEEAAAAADGIAVFASAGSAEIGMGERDGLD